MGRPHRNGSHKVRFRIDAKQGLCCQSQAQRRRVAQLTKAEARKLIKAHVLQLNKKLDEARSQFSIRMCYVSAHSDLVEVANSIVEKLDRGTE